ncbi:MAG: TonB-dependent receptor [Cyanobacteria bacterium P01_D01_bin.115]
MRRLHPSNSLWVIGVSGIFALQPALAKAERATVVSLSNGVETQIPDLSELGHSAPLAPERLAQLTTPQAIIRITDVQINATEAGFDLVLNTPEGELSPIAPSVLGNALIADIPNATLTLADSDEFQVADPVDGIALITVSNLPDNQVRVAITGIDAPPAADIRAVETGLVLSVSPTAVTSPETLVETAEAPIRIVVTAEKTPEDLQDVPISITALTEEAIADANINALEDIAANTPNFSVFQFGSRAFTNYSIRGLGNSNFLSRDAVGFYVDGVPYDWAAFIDFDLPNLERVEILRGPQSILYGRNAQAGVINLITRQPTNELEFNGGASYGSYNDRDLRVSISGPLVENELFYQLSGSYAARDGYTVNTVLDEDVDYQSGRTGRAQLLWTPTDNWEISFNAYVDDYSDGGYALAFLDQADPFEVEQTFNGNFDRTTNTQALRLAYDNPDFEFTSITARRFSQSESLFDADASAADIFRIRNDFDSTLWSQELRLQSPAAGDRWEWIVGGYFESRAFGNDEAQIFGDDAASLGAAPGAILTNGDVDETTLAAFGQVSYRLNDALTVTGGLRYESVNSTLNSYDNVFAAPDGTPLFTLNTAADIEQNSAVVLPRLAIEYRATPDVMLYGSVTRGYRPGGVNFRADNLQTLTFDEERSWNYEVGAKSSWWDDRFIVNLALFHNSVDNYQVLVGDLLNIDSIENADVSIFGGELEVRAIPLEGLEIIAGLGLVDAEFTDYSNPGTGEDFEGNQLTFSPSLTYNLAVQYRSDLGLLGRVELLGFGTTYFDDANTLKQDPYAIVNARLGYEFDNAGIYLFANNLFDTEYITQAFAFPPFGDVAAFGAPRTIGTQFRMQF